MADKEFKTIEEQIEILRSRGLSITDEEIAKNFLLRNNYYRILCDLLFQVSHYLRTVSVSQAEPRTLANKYHLSAENGTIFGTQPGRAPFLAPFLVYFYFEFAEKLFKDTKVTEVTEVIASTKRKLRKLLRDTKVSKVSESVHYFS